MNTSREMGAGHHKHKQGMHDGATDWNQMMPATRCCCHNEALPDWPYLRGSLILAGTMQHQVFGAWCGAHVGVILQLPNVMGNMHWAYRALQGLFI